MMPMPRKACYWIYILECDDGSYYTGYSTNLARRYRQHVDGTAGVKYTRTRRPIRIAQCWRLFDDVGTALRVESLLKRRGRTFKENVVREPVLLRPALRKFFDRRARSSNGRNV